MIIDCHTHIHPRADGWGDAYDASVATLVGQLHEGRVQRAVVLPIAPEVDNDFIAATCRQFPAQLVGFASVEPLKGQPALDELRRAVTDLKLKGLKLHPRLQGFSRDDFSQIVPLVELTAELYVPILMDAFPYGQTLFKNYEVELISDLAEAVPKARFIMAHAGGYRVLEALLVAKAHRNVYLDISFTLQYFRGSSVVSDLAFVIQRMRGERVVYGSDHPYVTVSTAFQEMSDFLEQCNLTSSQLDNIFGRNLTELIGD